MTAALDYADQHFDQFVIQLKDLLRIPSISTDPAYSQEVRRAAEWIVADLLAVGFKQAELCETDGHPIILAEHIVDPSLPTVLVYGHYDVQPPDPLELWETAPFEPVIRDGALYARGSCDDKGQLFMHLKAIESYLAGGVPLPCNLKLLIEGEEESGSVHLLPFIEANAEKLGADVAVISDTAMFAADVPSITSGLRGMAYVQVELTGPNRDLHSGVYGGAVENPINVLAKIIADLHDDNHHVTIPGFYDGAQLLSSDEKAESAALPFDDSAWMSAVGVSAVRTDHGIPILQAVSAHPTLDVNGIWGGYQGPGAKTVLPAKAGAKISMRLVPGQDPDDIVEKLRRHLESVVPETVTLKFENLHGGRPVLVDTEQPAMQAAAVAMEATMGKRPVFSREGGSIPVVADFKEALGIDTVLMGFGLNSDAIHSPNEHFGLDRFRNGLESIIRFLDEYGRQGLQEQ